MHSHDFVHNLADPEGWLRGVISNFVAYGFDPETCVIRRGIKGTGSNPNYRIDEPSRTDYLASSVDYLPSSVDLTGIPNRRFNGRSHGEMTWLDDCCRCDENWTEVGMTLNDAKMLLSRLSSSKGIH